MRTCTNFPSVFLISLKTSLPILFYSSFSSPTLHLLLLSNCLHKEGVKIKVFKQLRRHTRTYAKQCLPCWGTNVFLLSVKVNMQLLKFLERKRDNFISSAFFWENPSCYVENSLDRGKSRHREFSVLVCY